MSGEKIVPAMPIDSFSGALRNVRLALDGTEVTIDLVPSFVLEEPIAHGPFDPVDASGRALNKIVEGGRPILEASRFARLHFDWIHAVVVQDEFSALFPELAGNFREWPKIARSKCPFPIVEVQGSGWRAQLPDCDGGGFPNMKHYAIASMETCLNVLGVLDRIEWIEGSGE